MSFMRICAILLFLFNTVVTSAQMPEKVDFQMIGSITNDSASSFFYPNLINRLHKFDTTLAPTDFRMIYYGSVMSHLYKPLQTSTASIDFYYDYNEAEFDSAVIHGKEALAMDPVNLRLIYKMLVCFRQCGKNDTARMYARNYFGLLDAIYSSGDGRSQTSPFVLVRIEDELEILADLRLGTEAASLIKVSDTELIDVLTLTVPNSFNLKELFFDISKSINVSDIIIENK